MRELNIRSGLFYPDKYERLMSRVLVTGDPRMDRTGVGTRSVFGPSLRYSLQDGLPAVLTKRVHMKSVIGELMWFLSGSTDVGELRDKYGVTIWDEWALEDGTIGPGYGEQWRKAVWSNDVGKIYRIDQIKALIDGLKEDPFGRRHIVNAWNVGQLSDMALPPCHMMFQCYVHSNQDGEPTGLSLQLYQRSADMFLGVPFNITSYGILLAMLAQETGLPPRNLVISFGDAHIYTNHLAQVEEQLDRPRAGLHLPGLDLDPVASIFDHTPDTIHVTNYHPHGPITAPVAV